MDDKWLNIRVSASSQLVVFQTWINTCLRNYILKDRRGKLNTNIFQILEKKRKRNSKALFLNCILKKELWFERFDFQFLINWIIHFYTFLYSVIVWAIILQVQLWSMRRRYIRNIQKIKTSYREGHISPWAVALSIPVRPVQKQKVQNSGK